jgi:hypothetical protein
VADIAAVLADQLANVAVRAENAHGNHGGLPQ